MGRPRLSAKGVALVYSVRLPPEEARKVEAALRSSGQARPEWLRAALLAAIARE